MANQIGKLLDIKQIRSTLRNFDEDEKVVHIMHDTINREQECIFLTELGLYRLLGMSRKPIAKKFQKWVASVIKEIRINGKYELENELKRAIENNQKLIEENKHLDRNLPDDTIQDIGKSVVVRTQKEGFIAMLNINKDIIVQVFPDQKSATEERHFTSSASISQAIAQNRLSSGHYFCYYHDCSDELKNAYLAHSTLPKKPARSNAIYIKQLNPITKELINTYNSIQDVQIQFQASRRTIQNAISKKTILKGFLWSY